MSRCLNIYNSVWEPGAEVCTRELEELIAVESPVHNNQLPNFVNRIIILKNIYNIIKIQNNRGVRVINLPI